jgi:hypothetical protein
LKRNAADGLFTKPSEFLEQKRGDSPQESWFIFSKTTSLGNPFAQESRDCQEIKDLYGERSRPKGLIKKRLLKAKVFQPLSLL